MAQPIDLMLPSRTPDRGTTALSERPATLEGQTLGFIWNSKPNADALFDEFVARVEERHYSLGGIQRHLKPGAAMPAAPADIDDFADRCGAVIAAVGD